MSRSLLTARLKIGDHHAHRFLIAPASLPRLHRPGFTLNVICLVLSFLLLSFLAPHAQAAPQPVGISVDSSSQTWLLWNNPDSSVALTKINPDGSVAATQAYAAISGWGCTAVAAGTSTPHLLWQRASNGQASVWTLDANGAFSASSPGYGPAGGYTAQALTVDGDSQSRLLLKQGANNLFSVWTLAGSSYSSSTPAYGPYATGSLTWDARALAGGSDSLTRLLLVRSDGAAAVWTLNSSGFQSSSSAFAQPSGYSCLGLAVGGDNLTRLLWANTSGGGVGIWTLSSSGGSVSSSTPLLGPPAGYVAVGMAAGLDNLVRLLWSDGQGDAQVWTIAAGGTYTVKIYPSLSTLAVSPASVTGGSSATATVTLTNPAPVGGVTVALSSSSTSASVPASVLVAAGSTAGTFTVTTTAVSAAATATVTATFSGISKTATLTVNPASTLVLSSVTLGQYGIVAGTIGSGTVTFTGASSVATTVTCSSNDPSLSVPASLNLPANQNSIQLSYTANDVFYPTVANVSVSYNGQTQTTQITVQPAIQLTASATGNDANGNGKISLFWTGVANATGYNIYRQSTSGGAFSRIASNVNTQDTGPILMPTYVYTNTGLANGNSYAYYVVAVISGGYEKGTSNADTDTPDPTGIPWDTGNAANIVAAVQAEAAAAVIPDPEDPDQTPEPVGTLMIASPDGVVYMGNLPDGSAAQAFPAAGYYDATSNQINYSDGTSGVGSPDAMSIPYSGAQSSSLSPNATIGATPLQATPPTGITRQIQSQPGLAGMAATVALPNALDPTVVNLAYNGSGFDQKGKPHNYNSVGDIYTGGHIVYPASVVAAAMSKHLKLGGAFANIDAGLQLTEYPVANSAWQPLTLGTANQNILLGGAGGNPVTNLYKIFITGQVLMEFETPAISRIKSKHILMHYTQPYTSDSNLYGNFSITLKRQTGGKDSQGNPVYSGNPLNETSVTLFYTGGSAVYWKKVPYDPAHPEYGNNNFVIKRTNSIAQTLNPVAATPGIPPVYTGAPVANGPGLGFYMDGSYILGGAWGVNDTNGVVLLYPGTGYESWTDSNTVTSLAGSYPLDTRYIKWNASNPYFYEPNLNMRTSLGNLPGF